MIHPMWEQYPSISKDLQKVTEVLNHSIKNRNTELTNVLQEFLTAGGKYLRPAYFLLFSEFGTYNSNKKRYQLAAAIEILHTATLVHDDVVDEAYIRRNLPTVKATYDNQLAVYTGDFLFTVYFDLLSQSVDDPKTMQRFAKNMKLILIGELDQMHLKYNPRITLKQYLHHIKGKTAQLFQLSCYQGATFARCSPKVKLLAEQIGLNIGMAFQILDDILDYSVSSNELKKPVLEDVRSGVYTLPLILAIDSQPDAFTELLAKKADMSDEEVKKVASLVHQFGGVTKAQNLAQRYTEKALTKIQALPNIPAKDILYEVTQQLLKRKN